MGPSDSEIRSVPITGGIPAGGGRENLPFRFYLISDRARMGPDPVEAVGKLAEAGLPAFQWREKDLPPGENYEYLQHLHQRLAGTPQVRLFVNDRADMAVALGLHLHLTETSIPTRVARDLLPPGKLLGRSVHSVASARAAEAEGADFITFGPVYDTPSKRAYGPPQGINALREACRAVVIPVLALGGINVPRIAECLDAGAHGVAVIGAIWDASDPPGALRQVLRNLGEEPR